MTPEQNIRALAAQATATLMAPMQPQPADFVAVAEVVEAYIREGKEAAFALTVPFEQEISEPQQPEEIQPVAQQAVADAPRQLPVQDAAPKLEPVPDRQADVIQMAGRSVSPKQQEARSIIERKKKERVDALVAQASVAKVRAHKQRLLDEAEESGLSAYPVVINGAAMTLGSYLGSLLGS